MNKLTREALYSLEKYAEIRAEFRTTVMAHKKHRQVALGEHATLYFEDRLTMQYQVQEMLRAEKIFESVGIQEELEAYNPLIPDGSNWKATFMIEYSEVEERQKALAEMKGIDDKVWVQVAGHEKVYAIANEDLERTNEEKTSSVHFMRFELEPVMIQALKVDAALNMGIDHPAYTQAIEPVSDDIKQALLEDLEVE